MQFRISLRRAWFITSTVGMIFVSVTMFLFAPYVPVHGYAEVSLPARLTIPKIKVDAAIEQVGLTPEGAVGIPKGLTHVAWFNLWPHPGAIGNAIIVGHYGRWKNGAQGVFNDLKKLKKGDRLYLKDAKGATIVFVVRKIATYDQNEEVSEVFSSSDGKAHLNLITCEGVWNKVTKRYSKRLVVFTDKE